MRLLDPFGLIAGTWDLIYKETGGMPIGGLILMALVIAVHLIVALGVLTFVVSMAGHFAEGFRKGFRGGMKRHQSDVAEERKL